MTYRLRREPVVTEYAAIAAVSAVPGRNVWVRQGPLQGNIYIEKLLVEGGRFRITGGRVIGDTGTHIIVSNPVWEILTYFPPVPASPAQGAWTVVTGRTGWDGGGRTVKKVRAGDRFTFKFKGLGIIAGLARPGASYSFSTARHAWYRNGERLELIENGRVVMVFAPNIPDFAFESWTFGVERIAGLIRYFFIPAEGAPANIVYASQDVGGDLVGIAMPYTVGDYVDPVGVSGEGIGTLYGDIPAVVGRMSSGGYAGMAGTVPAITGRLVSDLVAKVDSSVPAVAGRMGQWSAIAGTVHGVSGQMRSEPVLVVNSIYSVVGGVLGGMSGVAGSVGRVADGIPAVLGRLEQIPHGRIRADVGYPVTGRMSDYVPDASINAISVGVRTSLENPLLLISVDGVGVGCSASITIIIDLVTADGLQLSDSTSIGSLVELITREGLYVNDGGSSLARREALQYAINLATGAPSVYQGFDFQGFVSIDGVSYGWRQDGLYRIGVSGDDAETIRAMVDFGISDYGTAQSKRLATAWLGLRTDGQAYLRMRADDGAEHVYRAIQSHDTHRAVLAKGVTGRQWSVVLEIEDASFASMDSMEIEVAVSQRRFGSR